MDDTIAALLCLPFLLAPLITLILIILDGIRSYCRAG
jgi:hypothetical protein